MPELKSCPFCGNDDIFVEPDERGSGGQWVGPIHIGCGIHSKGCGAQLCEDTEADAIAAWNRRAAPTKGDVLMDAERYQFLRNRAIYHGIGMDAQPSSPWCVIGTSHESSRPCDGDELDAAIDAASRQEQPHD